MYDMYHWDQPDPAAGSGTERPRRRVNGTERPRRQVHGAGRPAQPERTGAAGPGGGTGATGPAAHAVQVALDRRDNGGDVGAPSGK
ncbi:MAG TPA: hypothetical protein VF256_03615 [Streptosporangiaceae bacterium]